MCLGFSEGSLALEMTVNIRLVCSTQIINTKANLSKGEVIISIRMSSIFFVGGYHCTHLIL